MSRKIFRSGNSAVVSLPSDVLEATGLAISDEVNIVADAERGYIIISPAGLQGVRPGLLEKVDRFIDRYQSALESLAGE